MALHQQAGQAHAEPMAQEPAENFARGEAQSSNSNEQIRRYLDDYLAFPHRPGFAVLLTGPWGGGKTFLVRELIERQAALGKTVLSVSLYGLSSRQEIAEALLDARYPTLGQMRRDQFQRAGQANYRAVPVGSPDADAYVFDDLERCAMRIADALGFINLLVERDGRKVLVVANEERARGRGRLSYVPAKEKVIGQSFTVAADFTPAFDSFLSKVDFEPTAKLLDAFRDEIESLFVQSGLGNLRILQRSIWDFERVHRELRPEHRGKAEAMGALARLIFPLSFEFRAERLVGADLRDRFKQVYGGTFDDNAVKSPLRSAAAKYPGVRLTDTILPDDVLSDLLVDGFVKSDAVQSALDASSWFQREDESSWRVVWHAFERRDTEVEAAAAKLMDEFRDRAYTRTGDLIHVFGQMLKLTEFCVTGWTVEQTYVECRRYIDDLRAQGRLEAPTSPVDDETRYGTYGGLGFYRGNDLEFGELLGYMNEQRRLAEIDRYPEKAEELLAMMDADPDGFASMIGPRQGVLGKYATVPVLASLDAQKVAEKLIELEPLQFNEVLLALSGRYDLGAFRRWLGQELPWAKQLRDALLDRAVGLSIYGRKRVTQQVDAYLSPHLNDTPTTSP